MISKMAQQHIRDVLTDFIVAIRSINGKCANWNSAVVLVKANGLAANLS